MAKKLILQALIIFAVITVAAFFTPRNATAVGVGKTCGGIAGIQCDADLWCDLRAGRCGAADIQGKCARVPAVCPKGNKNIREVCGCDNKTYNNDCERQMAKVQKASNGKCK